MGESASKRKKVSKKSSVLTARFPTERVQQLRRLYPGRSNQEILTSLADEKLARQDLVDWMSELQKAQTTGDLDLEAI